MSMKLGYLLGTAIFAVLFISAVVAQVKAARFHPVLYWVTIITTTMVGTTLADFADRSLGIGYAGGASLLFIALMAFSGALALVTGLGRIESVNSPKGGDFLLVHDHAVPRHSGQALGDWTADTAGLGYTGAALLFGSLLALLLGAHLWTSISKTTLFWAAFILTRPLGAVLGDFLDKPDRIGRPGAQPVHGIDGAHGVRCRLYFLLSRNGLPKVRRISRSPQYVTNSYFVATSLLCALFRLLTADWRTIRLSIPDAA